MRSDCAHGFSRLPAGQGSRPDGPRLAPTNCARGAFAIWQCAARSAIGRRLQVASSRAPRHRAPRLRAHVAPPARRSSAGCIPSAPACLRQPRRRRPKPFPPPRRLRLSVANCWPWTTPSQSHCANPRCAKWALAGAARATADVAYAPFLPEFGTSFRYSAFTQPVLPGGAFVPASLPAGVESFIVAEAGVQYTIADFGRRAGHYGAAVHLRAVRVWLGLAGQTVAFEATEGYFRLLAAESLVRVRSQALRDAERILDDTCARREGGVEERESVLRAEVEVSLARQSLLTARQAVQDGLCAAQRRLGTPGHDAAGDRASGRPS